MPLAVNLMKSLPGGRVEILEILFSFRRPEDVRPYESFFEVPVHFDQPQTGLVLTTSSLALPVIGASPAEFSLLQQQAAEGTSFHELPAEARFGIARELLAVTDLAAGDIAVALSYANQPAFNDAFRRWSGMTPQQWKKAWLTPDA